MGVAASFLPLKPGDVVDIVAPASQCPGETFNGGLRQLREWGLVPRVPDVLFGATPFVSNTQAERERQLLAALRAHDSKAVWCARGGYGCIHLLDKLARTTPPRVHKPLIGFSDVSALSEGLRQHWGWPSIHGPVLSQLAPGRLARSDVERVRRLLFGLIDEQSFGNLRLHPNSRRPKRAVRGPLVGGNLATLQSLCGSVTSPRFRGAVVMFEDVNERGYVVDRLLRSLEAAGAFAGVRAIVMGQFLNAREPGGRPSLVRAAINNLAVRLRAPVFTGLPVGHGSRLPSLVIGVPVELAQDDSQRWRLYQRF